MRLNEINPKNSQLLPVYGFNEEDEFRQFLEHCEESVQQAEILLSKQNISLKI
jgi:hypothetical protein